MKQESPNCDLRMGHLILWSILGSPWDHVMLDIQKNIQILCAHDFGTRKHGNLVVIVFFSIFLSIFFRSSMDDAVGHPVEEFGSAESQRYLRQDSLPVISGPQIARIRNIDIIEGSLEVKLPTIWTDEKQRWEESEKRREEERRSQKRKPQKKEVREKVGKSRNTVFFQ